MSVRQRVLHSAPLIAFALAIVFLGLSLGGLRSRPIPLAGRRAGQSAADESLRAGRGRVRPRLVHHAGLVVVAAAPGPRRRQSPRDHSPSCPRQARPGVGFGLVVDRRRRSHSQARTDALPSPAVGSGGYVGALAAIFLEVHFGPVGMRLILAAAGTFRAGALPRRGLLVAGPGNPSAGSATLEAHAGANRWPRSRRSDTGDRTGSGDWESPDVITGDRASTRSVSMHPPIPVTNGERRAASSVSDRRRSPRTV